MSENNPTHEPRNPDLISLIDVTLEPTTKKELLGWYCYDWANSVYSSVGIVAAIPLLLYRLAEQADGDNYVEFGGSKIPTASVTSGVIGISVAFQAIAFISTGALADFGKYRKLLLGITSLSGSTLTVLFILLPDFTNYAWILAVILTILTNVLFGMSIVFYNAFLPLLVDAHPDTKKAIEEKMNNEEFCKQYDERTNVISTRGFAAGYASGVFLLLIAGVVILLLDSSEGEEYELTSLGLRLAMVLTGLWWFGFSLYTLKHLKTRPGPPLPSGENYILYPWKRIYTTLKHALKLKNTLKFLVAFFIYSDGYSTIASVGVLFGKDELGMTTSETFVIAVLSPLMALVGNYFYLWIHRKYNLESKTILLINLFQIGILPVYGLVGLNEDGHLGLKSYWEVYIFSIIYGFNLGSVQSFSRVIFAELIPTGHESEMFSLYEVTDKGSSWIGPLVVAIVYNWTTSMRYTLIYLVIAIFIPMPIVYNLNIPEGIIAARTFEPEVCERIRALSEKSRDILEGNCWKPIKSKKEKELQP